MVEEVTIAMAAEELKAAQEKKQELEKSQPVPPVPSDGSTPVPPKVEVVNPKVEVVKEVVKKEEKPELTEEKKKEAGRPCEFCGNRTKIMQKVYLYKEYCEGKVDGKFHIPYLQELCGYGYLDVLTTHLWGWINNERHEAEHAELSNTIKMIMERQQLRLLQRSLGQNPAGAIFQLKANHGMIETEKQILAGSNGEPFQYNINIIPRKQPKEIEDE